MEQNGGSCAGERSRGEVAGAESGEWGAHAAQGCEPAWGSPGPRRRHSGSRSRRPSRSSGAFPASRAGGLLHPLPPGPVPLVRCWRCRDRAWARTAYLGLASRWRKAWRKSSVSPAEERRETPCRLCPEGDFPIPPAGPKQITKRKPHTDKPRSPESFPPPSSSRPRIQETPLRPSCPPTDAPLSPTLPTAQPTGPRAPVLQNGCPGPGPPSLRSPYPQ